MLWVCSSKLQQFKRFCLFVNHWRFFLNLWDKQTLSDHIHLHYILSYLFSSNTNHYRPLPIFTLYFLFTLQTTNTREFFKLNLLDKFYRHLLTYYEHCSVCNTLLLTWKNLLYAISSDGRFAREKRFHSIQYSQSAHILFWLTSIRPSVTLVIFD